MTDRALIEAIKDVLHTDAEGGQLVREVREAYETKDDYARLLHALETTMLVLARAIQKKKQNGESVTS